MGAEEVTGGGREAEDLRPGHQFPGRVKQREGELGGGTCQHGSTVRATGALLPAPGPPFLPSHVPADTVSSSGHSLVGGTQGSCSGLLQLPSRPLPAGPASRERRGGPHTGPRPFPAPPQAGPPAWGVTQPQAAGGARCGGDHLLLLCRALAAGSRPPPRRRGCDRPALLPNAPHTCSSWGAGRQRHPASLPPEGTVSRGLGGDCPHVPSNKRL